MLDTFLNILAIIGIIAVGAFIIVFLSDLLISIIDNSNGIFFKRHKNDNGYKEGGRTYTRPVLLNKNKEEEHEALTYEEKPREFAEKKVEKVEEKVVEQSHEVDMQKAQEEERLLRGNVNNDRQRFVNERQNDSKPMTPPPAPKPVVAPKPVQKKEEPKEDIDSIIAEVSKQSLMELSAQEEKEKQRIAAQQAEEKTREAEEKVRQADAIVKQAEERAQQAEERAQQAEAKTKEAEDRIKLADEKAKEMLAEKEKEIEEKAAELDKKSKETEEKANELQKQIEELQKKIETDKDTIAKLEEEAKNKKEEVKIVEVPSAKSTKQEILDRLDVLKQRLKQNEKELSQNKKEYIPLKRVSLTLESDKKKLRRKEAIVAKQKVVLYGVNNYVDIDEEKAKKLAEELDLLEGLRLSVQHCEEVMSQNKDRFPILERTNKILSRTVGEIKEDIASLENQLKEIEEEAAKEEVVIPEELEEVVLPEVVVEEETKPETTDTTNDGTATDAGTVDTNATEGNADANATDAGNEDTTVNADANN